VAAGNISSLDFAPPPTSWGLDGEGVAGLNGELALGGEIDGLGCFDRLSTIGFEGLRCFDGLRASGRPEGRPYVLGAD